MIEQKTSSHPGLVERWAITGAMFVLLLIAYIGPHFVRGPLPEEKNPAGQQEELEPGKKLSPKERYLEYEKKTLEEFSLDRTINFAIVAGLIYAFCCLFTGLREVYRDLTGQEDDFDFVSRIKVNWGMPEVLSALLAVFIFGSLPLWGSILQGRLATFGHETMTILTLVSETAGILFAFALVKYTGGKIAETGLHLRGLIGKAWRGFAAAISFIPFFPFIVFTSLILQEIAMKYGYYPEPDDMQELIKSLRENNPNFLWFMLFFAVVCAPILEEIFFRGIFFGALRKNLGFWSSAIICGVIFGIAHGALVKVLPIAVLGIILCYLREKSESLIAPIMMHATYNFIISITMAVTIL